MRSNSHEAGCGLAWTSSVRKRGLGANSAQWTSTLDMQGYCCQDCVTSGSTKSNMNLESKPGHQWLHSFPVWVETNDATPQCPSPCRRQLGCPTFAVAAFGRCERNSRRRVEDVTLAHLLYMSYIYIYIYELRMVCIEQFLAVNGNGIVSKQTCRTHRALG